MASTPTLPKPFGPWILNEGFEIVGDNIKYTAYKTNDLQYYDSFALSNLQNALVKSFLDSDLQQYAAFTTAVEQLTGTVDWVLDSANKQIEYTDPNSSNPNFPHDEYLYQISGSTSKFNSQESACKSILNEYYDTFISVVQTAFGPSCKISGPSGNNTLGIIERVINPNYDPQAEQERKTLPLDNVAQQVISNAANGADEVLKLLSEDYINLVANSIFDSNPAKQFVKLSDLNSQLEANKVLR